MLSVPAAPLGTDSGGNHGEECDDEVAHLRLHIFQTEIAAEQAHAAIDVVADTARRDDTGFDVGCSHSSDGKTITPVDVRHTEGHVEDAGEIGYVLHLL